MSVSGEEGNFEIACRSLDRLKICIGNDFDVEMPADLDQFG
jgi:hypothetical protein